MTALEVAQGALLFGLSALTASLTFELAQWWRRRSRTSELSIQEQNQRTEHHLWWHRVKGTENCPWCREEDQ